MNNSPSNSEGDIPVINASNESKIQEQIINQSTPELITISLDIGNKVFPLASGGSLRSQLNGSDNNIYHKYKRRKRGKKK